MWMLVGLAILHLIAWAMLSSMTSGGFALDQTTIVPLAGTMLLAAALMLSQAIESVTRVFYARGDLDLLLSSPLHAGAICAIRMGTIALSSGLMTTAAAAAFINVMAYLHGAGWLLAYLVIPAMGAGATALAIVITLGLFHIYLVQGKPG